ncbi:MAG: hypothetical protein HY716_06590 [Planctomycetes bacterium]|nr:hypothetical protein [Planctomycetota bacterium]
MEGIRSSLIRLALAAVPALVSACDHVMTDPHLESFGQTEEDLNAPPNKSEIRARLTADVRQYRLLQYRLDEGRREMPPEIRFDEHHVNARRAKDDVPLWRVPLRADSPERLSAVEETIYYDDEAKLYYYHYRGGDPYRDVWFGPLQLRFSSRPEVQRE